MNRDDNTKCVVGGDRPFGEAVWRNTPPYTNEPRPCTMLGLFWSSSAAAADYEGAGFCVE